MRLETQALRVPFESASRLFRLRQKHVERALSRLAEACDAPPSGDAAADAARLSAAADAVEAAASQVGASVDAEAALLERVARRAAAQREGRRPRLDLDGAIAEHLLRGGFDAAAAAVLAELTPTQRDGVDVDELRSIALAVAALRRRDVRPALDWVAANGSRLRRIESVVDVHLHAQALVEIARGGAPGGQWQRAALEYAREHLAPAATAASRQGPADADGAAGSGAAAPPPPTPASGAAAGAGDDTRARRAAVVQQQVQLVSSCVIYPDPARCGVRDVERLFGDDALGELEAHFRRDALAAAGFLAAAPLELMLAAGLSALATPACRAVPAPAPEATGGGRAAPPPAVDVPLAPLGVVPCAVCHPPHYFAAALAATPQYRHSVSRLIDPVSHEVMDDANPPLVLPSGRVFGARTLELLLSDDGAQVACPAMGAWVNVADVRRAYFVS